MGMNAVGLILAAGLSSRMGAFKPLLPIGDATALERIAETYRAAGVDRVVGVTGYQRELLEPYFEAAGIVEAYNPDYEQGMFTSIKAGIRKALELSAPEDKKPDGFFLMLVDCPLVPPKVVERIWEKHSLAPEDFIVPCCRGKKGHPLFIPSAYADEILAHDGEGGLKAITSRHEDRMIRLETGIEAVVLDMDTPEGYEEVLEYWRKYGCASGLEGSSAMRTETIETEDLAPDWSSKLVGKRIFLVRHGEIRQHKEKIFLGQSDVPLSEKGKEQAAAAAEELLRSGISTKRIYASDLSRTMETAEIIAERLPRMEVISMPRLREMSLGDWDGRYISEIREQFPEEYRKRGENLLTYKYGNDSENYYDLQYRAMKGFEDILKREREAGDENGDIVIVTHSGVIAVLRNNLLNTKLEEEMNGRISNGGVSMMDFTKEKEAQK